MRANEDGHRRPWIDNLRTVVIVLVVNMHCCVTYSYVGDWYLKDGPEGWLADKLPYTFWIFHLQSFFMGLLFFLAGSLADQAIRRRGTKAFIRERVFRLGAPAAMYMVLIHPLIVYGLMRASSGEADVAWRSFYVEYLTTGQVFSGSGPMWFVLALMLFSLLLAAWRTVVAPQAPHERAAPSAWALGAFAVALAIATAITRGVVPVGTTVFNFFQLCYFPQYVAAFAVGVAAGAGGWLDALAASRRAKVAGWLALIGGPLLLAFILVLGGGPAEGPLPGEHGPILYFGGWNWHAYGAAMWEQLTGVGLALGILALSWRRLDHSTSLSRWLADRSFAVYVFHAPILVLLTLSLHLLPASPLSKIIMLTMLGLASSFIAADLAKRLPGLRKIV